MNFDLSKSAHLDPFFAYLAFSVSLVLVVLKWLHLYSGFRAENFKLSSQRTERLFRLVSEGSWRKASPATLMMAYGDAFRRELDDRLIRFALGRHRPLPLLRDLRRCVGMVKIADDGTHLVRKAGFKFKRLSYRSHSQFAFLAAFIPYVLAAMTGKYLVTVTSHHTVGVIFGVLLLGWIPTMMVLANAFETAHRLVEVLDDVYPVWDDNPSASAFATPAPLSASQGAVPSSSADLKTDRVETAAS